MKTKTDNKSNQGAPLRVLEVGGVGSNWSIKAIKVPGVKRHSTFAKYKITIKSTKSNAPLRVLEVGGVGSSWTVKSKKVPGVTRY